MDKVAEVIKTIKKKKIRISWECFAWTEIRFVTDYYSGKDAR